MSETWQLIDSWALKSFIVIILIEIYTLFILSFLWSFYFIRELYNGRNRLRYFIGLKGSIPDFKWSIQVKNCQIKQIRNTFLLAISILEYTLILIVSLMISFATFQQKRELFNFGMMANLHYLENTDGFLKNDFKTKSSFALFLVMFMLIYILIRILTEFLCSCYTFYPEPAHNKSKLSRSLYILVILFMIGIIPHLELVSFACCILCMAYEFVRFVNATKQLRRYLYQRYFDSAVFENQSRAIVRYYKGMYQHFTIGSYLLISSLFLHLVSFCIFIFHPTLMCVLRKPFTFPTIILSEGKFSGGESRLPNEYTQAIDLYDAIVSLVEVVVFALGWTLLIIPYLLITIKGVSSNVFDIWRRQKPITVHRN